MKKIILPGMAAGFLMLIASLVFGMITNIVFPGLQTEYSNTNLFRPWSDPLMYYMFVHPLIMGIILSFVWFNVKVIIKEKDQIKKGALFGVYVWIFTIPGMLMSASTSPYSLLMLATWTISVLIQYEIAGILFSYMDKK